MNKRAAEGVRLLERSWEVERVKCRAVIRHVLTVQQQSIEWANRHGTDGFKARASDWQLAEVAERVLLRCCDSLAQPGFANWNPETLARSARGFVFGQHARWTVDLEQRAAVDEQTEREMDLRIARELLDVVASQMGQQVE